VVGKENMMKKTAWEAYVVAVVVATMKAQAEAGAVGQSAWKPVKESQESEE
jgi:hypothetical protein